MRTSGDAVAATAVNASGMNGTTPEAATAGAHAATMKPPTPAKAPASASAASGRCIIGNQGGSNENDRREADQTVSNHGHPPVFAVSPDPLGV